MRREFAFAFLAFLAASFAPGQETALPVWAAPAPDAAQTAYYAGPGVTPPELLPATLTDAATGHCKKLDGTVALSAIVDAKGVTHNIFFIRPIGNDLDKMALSWVAADRFKPGTHDGTPAAVVISAEVGLKTCIKQEMNQVSQEVYVLRLRSAPDQKVELQRPPSAGATLTLGDSLPSQPDLPDMPFHNGSRDISAPVVLKHIEAVYSDKAREQRISGICLIVLIVDSHGMPQNLRIARGLEPSLDQNALYAVSQYRFKPAMKKDGTPIPSRIAIEVDFRLY